MTETNEETALKKKIADIDRQLLCKMKILQKQVGFAELFDESSRIETEQLETTLKERLEEVDSLITELQESTLTLRHVADRQQSADVLVDLKQRILDNELVIEQVSLLLKIQDLLEATQSCRDDPVAALKYLDSIESSCTELNDWSNGNLKIVKSISQFVVNKRYTLEAEQRKALLKLKETNHETEKFSESSVPENEEVSAFLGKIRDILRKPFEPTENVESVDFGGPGNVDPCRVSFWLRPLVIEIIETSCESDAIDLYSAIYNQLIPKMSARDVALFYCNSMYFAHKVYLHSMFKRSRIALDSAIVLRKIAGKVLMERIQKIRFESSTHVFDEIAIVEYPSYFRKYCSDFREILPKKIHERLIGLLGNHYLGSIVHVVTHMEDIESTQADRWAGVMSKIIEEFRTIVQGLPVEMLAKAEELKNILGYGLRDFATNWKNPTSQLRLHFQPDEVRHLIRAIFQSSDMQSSVLSQIQ